MTIELSEYRVVWILAMFDLPTNTKKERKDYTIFRNNPLKDGFTMLQYSVYIRHCASKENADVHRKRIRDFLPPEGEVRLLNITDKQYGRMETFWGKKRKPVPPPPRQLELF